MLICVKEIQQRIKQKHKELVTSSRGVGVGGGGGGREECEEGGGNEEGVTFLWPLQLESC